MPVCTFIDDTVELEYITADLHIIKTNDNHKLTTVKTTFIHFGRISSETITLKLWITSLNK